MKPQVKSLSEPADNIDQVKSKKKKPQIPNARWTVGKDNFVQIL